MKYIRGRRAPFIVPAAVVLAIGAGAAVPTLSGASAPPSLSPVTPSQLVAEVLSAQPPHLSGQLTWTSNLGLGDLVSAAGEIGSTAGGAQGGAFDPLSMLNGSYTADVWLDGAKAERVALSPQAGEELDLVRNGDQAWAWDSSTMTVQHYLLPVGGDQAGTTTTTTVPSLTPQQEADRILSGLAQWSTVTVPGTVWVAGKPTYELLVTPPQGTIGTTIDHIEIDIGSGNGLAGIPLQVAVYANGQARPAADLGFTGTIQTGPPPAGELTFTPPPGAKVVDHNLGPMPKPVTDGSASTGGTSRAGGAKHTIGSGWTVVYTANTQVFDNVRYRSALDATTTVVAVGGQQARLFSSALVNALVMPDGTYFAGFVSPGLLEAAANQAAGA